MVRPSIRPFACICWFTTLIYVTKKTSLNLNELKPTGTVLIIFFKEDK